MTTLTVRSSIGPVQALGHSLTLAGRNARKIFQNPEQLIDVTLQPLIMMLLFTYVFGGALGGDRDAYLQMLLPGVMVQTTLFASLATGMSLCTDISKGVFDRFRSMPIGRSAPLVGAVLADVVRFTIAIVIMLGFGYLMGFRIQTSVFAALLDIVLMIGFGLSLCWVSVWVGMLVKNPQAVPGAMIAFILPLGFASNIFVPSETMPGWLKAFTDINPVTFLTDVNRALLTGGPVGSHLLGALAWMAGFVLVFYPLAMRAYKRRMGG
ncbi:oleandomycin transport system permease protein [Kibdelosporangium banguiense]|uniref:Transport permease protein n=1 Tax=Kibdelosporangium banguiense TaxID=1365924 RepID=A0ABS4TA79_9PSEU|nr:ABC transporter permease [Kibdelosporangium banguiense]MBP2321331.1 oleandomycin transport system permease protein [Kibdelosporangium banguiense]